MITLNLIQGTDEWLKAKLDLFGASEAPAMMNDSKYMSRSELLKQKFTGKTKPVSATMQKIFDKGHATEEMARPIVEKKINDELYPVTGQLEDSKIMASFDGLTMLEDVVFEHKLFNATLAENVSNGILEAHYYWQLEQQLLVSGAEKAIFVTSDGTEDNFESMEYVSLPERRKALIAGWAQFEKDLSDYQPEVKKEIVVAQEQEQFPVIECKVEGSKVISNLGAFIPTIKAAIDERLSVILETDQDFADTEAFVKNIKTTRTNLKQEQVNITNAFESYSAFVSDVKATDDILQKAESKLNAAVKSHKEAKKLSIVNNANKEFNEHLAKLSEGINGVQITQIIVDFAASMKGKRSFEKMEEAVDAEIAKAKIESNEIAQVIRKNLDSLTELAKDHKFLFSDHAELMLKDNDDLVNLIKTRINEHEASEAKRKAEEKAKIEAEAKENAEREAQAKIKAEEKRIRDEERLKVEAEQGTKTEQGKSFEDTVTTGAGIMQDGKRIAPEDIYQEPEHKPAAQLASKTRQANHEANRELTPKESMIKQLKFWQSEYGVRDNEFNDLMNIINQYI